MDPKALASVDHQSNFAEVAEMAGHVRLSSAYGVCELAHAQLVKLDQEQEATQARVMC